MLMSPKYTVDYTTGSASRHRQFREEKHFKLSSWSFLTDLDSLNFSTDYGNEFEFDPKVKQFGQLLQRGSNGATYSCTLNPQYPQKEYWVPLALNKYEQCVAGILVCKDPQRCLVVLPQMPEFHTILEELIGHWCATWRPKLFPFHEAGRYLSTGLTVAGAGAVVRSWSASGSRGC